jgi:hypothetical protein
MGPYSADLDAYRAETSQFLIVPQDACGGAKRSKCETFTTS